MSWLQDHVNNPKLWTLFIERPKTLFYTKFKVKKYPNQELYSQFVKNGKKPEEDIGEESEECMIFHQVQLKFVIENHNLQGLYYNRKDKILLAEIGALPYDTLFREMIMGSLNGEEFQDLTEIDSHDIVSCQELAVECLCRTVFVEQYKAGVITREECEAKAEEKSAKTAKNSNLKKKKKE